MENIENLLAFFQIIDEAFHKNLPLITGSCSVISDNFFVDISELPESSFCDPLICVISIIFNFLQNI